VLLCSFLDFFSDCLFILLLGLYLLRQRNTFSYYCIFKCVSHTLRRVCRLPAVCNLLLYLLLLLGLHLGLLLSELFNSIREDLSIVVWAGERVVGRFLNPKVLRGLKVVSED